LQVRVLSPLPDSSVEDRTTQQERSEAIVFRGISQYLTESWSELKKVAWPTRQTVVNLTLIVLAVSVAVGIYIAVLDAAFHALIDQVL
jgi:preprotein translocase subunit SecE